MTHAVPALSAEQISSLTETAIRAIPPAFPLAATVAVNPFLGQSETGLPETAALLSRVAGCAVTASRPSFANRIARGEITAADIAAALTGCGATHNVAEVLAAAKQERPAPAALPTVSALEGQGLAEARIGAWAAGYFDQGQALWSAQPAEGAYANWRQFACHDLQPELSGLPGIRASFAALPESAEGALAWALAELGITEAAAPLYSHRLLMSLGGWAQAARYRLWQAELAGEAETSLPELLAIRAAWDAVLLAHRPGLGEGWDAARAAYAAPITPSRDDEIDAILQEAAERSAQRALAETLGAAPAQTETVRPTLQAAFCIDVRSEVMRRALESQSPEVETLGFAGFFGLTVAHTPAGICGAEARLPVLLTPGLESRAEGDHAGARIAGRAKRAWGRFRQAAVSSFAFVEATGPLYAGKLVRDTLGLGQEAQVAAKPVLDPPLPLAAQIEAAATILGAMSLRENFAQVVLIAGHGAHVTNNAHGSALQCGACGGYSGDVNARLLADVLNQPEVRTGLADTGIVVPQDTVFLAALHDTAQDSVTLYLDDLTEAQRAGAAAVLAQVEGWCRGAGALARAERLATLPGAASEGAIARRALDWAETRPEWGLAGCKAFVVAPRGKTARARLDGRVFLHSYDWRQDEGFGVLELILTAPVVVASWISLQYYGSVVAPEVFGSGTKQVHNVTGGMGVLDGASGALRVGLSRQSVHDGAAFVHDPLRLSVVVDAPAEAITEILARHPGVQALFDNGWLKLLRMDESGAIAERYAGALRWEAFHDAPKPSLAAR
ncbi:YbcC family protein [Dinoroseobacter sp. S124A]|uniref:YbcC family protein n=1 Tax=Dinoroseobacter sp. S124A TaxID=3415128 RepID=UPI003C7BEB8D